MSGLSENYPNLRFPPTEDALELLEKECAAMPSPFPWVDPNRLCYALLFEEATPSQNVTKEMHFFEYKQLRQSWLNQVFVALKGRRPAAPLESAGILMFRYSSGSLDWDNCYGGVKPLFDCLVSNTPKNPSGLGLIVDDNPKCIPFPPLILQRPAKRGTSRTALYIYDLRN